MKMTWICLSCMLWVGSCCFSAEVLPLYPSAAKEEPWGVGWDGDWDEGSRHRINLEPQALGSASLGPLICLPFPSAHR